MKKREDLLWIRHLWKYSFLSPQTCFINKRSLNSDQSQTSAFHTRCPLVPWPQEGGRPRPFRDQVHVRKRHLYDWHNIAQNRLIGSADIWNILPEKGESERNWTAVSFHTLLFSLNLRETLILANVNTSGPERRGSEVVRQQQRPLELQINPGLAPGSGSVALTWAESGSRDCTNKVALLQRIPMRFPSKNGIEKGKVHYRPKVWGQ